MWTAAIKRALLQLLFTALCPELGNVRKPAQSFENFCFENEGPAATAVSGLLDKRKMPPGAEGMQQISCHIYLAMPFPSYLRISREITRVGSTGLC